MDARLRRHRGRNEYFHEGVQRALPGSADENRVREFGFQTSECGVGGTVQLHEIAFRNGALQNSREELLTPPAVQIVSGSEAPKSSAMKKPPRRMYSPVAHLMT